MAISTNIESCCGDVAETYTINEYIIKHVSANLVISTTTRKLLTVK